MKKIYLGTIEAPPSWYDAVYMSDTNTINMDTDILLGQFEHTEALGIEESYQPLTPQEIIIPDLPDHREGLYYFFLVTDQGNTVYEKGIKRIISAIPILLF